MLAVLVALAGCGGSGHRAAAGRSSGSSPSPVGATSSDAPSLSPAELQSQASAAAEVCAAWHDYYRYMTADPVAYNVATQSMLTMSGNSLGISDGNPQFPTMRADVEKLMAAAVANPLQPINSSTPGVAGLQRQCP